RQRARPHPFSFHHPAASALSALSLHDALPIFVGADGGQGTPEIFVVGGQVGHPAGGPSRADGAAVVAQVDGVEVVALGRPAPGVDRKSTRLNSSHVSISYAVFCLKKKTNMEGV